MSLFGLRMKGDADLSLGCRGRNKLLLDVKWYGKYREKTQFFVATRLRKALVQRDPPPHRQRPSISSRLWHNLKHI